MPFVATKNGVGDPNINRNGRPVGSRKDRTLTRRELKEREQMQLLRKFKPLVAEAISRASRILRADEAKHVDQLKAAVIILDNYKQLVNQVYDGNDDEMGEEVQPAQVYSLHVINSDDAEKQGDNE